jgi:hypothetical protein
VAELGALSTFGRPGWRSGGTRPAVALPERLLLEGLAGRRLGSSHQATATSITRTATPPQNSSPSNMPALRHINVKRSLTTFPEDLRPWWQRVADPSAPRRCLKCRLSHAVYLMPPARRPTVGQVQKSKMAFNVTHMD